VKSHQLEIERLHTAQASRTPIACTALRDEASFRHMTVFTGLSSQDACRPHYRSLPLWLWSSSTLNPDPDRLPANLFDRVDQTSDAHFYSVPRLVTHIDDATIRALTDYYREALPPGGEILDVMSSWVSHLPREMQFGRVAVLGMNRQELEANDRASESLVHDLNADPALPYPAESFDAVTNAVSVQYLVNPVAVFASIRRVLRPGGISIVAMSHRCFPTKAVRAFHTLPAQGRFDLVSRYCELAGGFDCIEHIDRSPPGADPLWIVAARRSSSD
jgi:hypothetical protein